MKNKTKSKSLLKTAIQHNDESITQIKNYFKSIGGKEPLHSHILFGFHGFYYALNADKVITAFEKLPKGYELIHLPTAVKPEKKSIENKTNDLTKIFNCFKNHEKNIVINGIEQRFIEQLSYSALAKDISDSLKRK